MRILRCRHKERLRTILKKLGKLKLDIEDPVVSEHLEVAYIELNCVLKMKVPYERLSTALEFKILDMREQGVLNKLIAYKFRVSQETVRRVVHKYRMRLRRKAFKPKPTLTTLQGYTEKRTSELPRAITGHSTSGV